MKSFLTLLAAALTAGSLLASPSPEELQKLNRKLAGELSNSLAEAEYSFLPDENGKRPEFSVSYYCPNCKRMHSGSSDELLKDERPFKTPAYAIAPGVFISSDIMIRPEWLDRLEISFGGKRYPARITMYYPDQKSVRLETGKPVEGIVPLKFNPGAEGARYAFFRVEENGIPVAGVRPWSEGGVIRELDTGKEYIPTPANVLVVNDKGEVLALSMQDKTMPGSGVTPSPEQWNGVSSDAFEKALQDFTVELEQNLYPVTIRLRQQRQAAGGGSRYRNREENRNEVEAAALRLRDDRLLITAALTPDETARIQRITFKEGEKEIPAQFEGSLKYFGAFTAKPEEKLPGTGIAFYDGDIIRTNGSMAYNVTVKNYGGKIDLKVRPAFVNDFQVGFRDMIVPRGSREGYLFSREGALLALPLARRSLERERYSSSTRPVSASMLASLLKDFDPYNVPHQGEEKIAWLGVEFQNLDPELARANHASQFTDNGSEGLLVSFVYPGSPAGEMGIKVSDILLAVTPAGSVKQERFKGYQYRNQMNRFPWERYDQVPPQYFDEIPPPWGTTRNALNELLGRIGIGNKAKLSYLAGGKVVDREFTVSGAPESFDTIAKQPDAALGVSLCDLTYEVRSYYQLTPEDNGVLVARVKAGERAAVAGIKPFEILVSVDGAPIRNLAEFKELIKDKKEYKLGVRRLAVTRIVSISDIK